MTYIKAAKAAHERIRPFIRRTPCMKISGKPFGIEQAVNLKLELFQHTGSFKPRGAFNSLLSENRLPKLVTAASGGNHGAAVAYAAQQLDIKSKIFVPEISSPSKQERIKRYGAELHVQGQLYADALALCEAYKTETGAFSVHAYDDASTIAGQSTVMLEWAEQARNLDTLLVAVGGGGLVAGMLTALPAGTRIIAVEPKGSSCLHQAMEAGEPVDVEVNSIAADSLGAKSIGPMAFDICQQYLKDTILVDDEDIIAAQKTLWNDYQIISEAGGATAFAALASKKYKPGIKERIGILVCGANADLSTFSS